VAALIEARSCERFKVLAENIKDKELAQFYTSLMASEAAHYTLFLGFARQYGKRQNVDKLWKELLQFEAKVLQDFGNKELIHG
jgi:tRNA-(ms[2]io[6]A)-hydroxylase